LDLENCTLFWNWVNSSNSLGVGGGAYLGTGGITVNACTISGNAAGLGGGIGTGTNGAPMFRNSILAYNTPGGDTSGTVIDGGHNICSDSTGAFIAPGSLNNTDPKLGPLMNYGGKTPTLSLLAGSPAIDGANPAFCTPTDQRGVPRPAGAGCDIGAYEAGPPFPLIFQRQTSDQFRLFYGGMAGQTFQLQRSLDLVNWPTLSTNTLGGAGYYEVIVTNSLNATTVFFRTLEP
jgi:hypothetical protein